MGWNRCTRNKPCHICGKPDWCCFTHDGAARCMRIQDAPDGWYICKVDDQGGTTFRPGDGPRKAAAPRPKIEPPKVIKTKNWGRIQLQLRSALVTDHTDIHAEGLGVSSLALHRLGIGWHEQWRCWTFPMYQPTGEIVGMRCRGEDGKKWAIPGSSDGLFLDSDIAVPEEVFICEGPTDTAALMDVGFYAVGRPSCRGAVIATKALARGRRVVIVSDSDGPGREGAEHLASNLLGMCRSVKVIEPPCKDMREWKQRGTSPEAVRMLVDHAKERRYAAEQVQSRAS